MNKDLIFRVIKRFIRAFVFGGLSAVSVLPLLAGFSITEIKTFVVVFVVAFLTGGFSALDKLTRDWK